MDTYSGIHIKPSHKGLLHEKLHVPQGQPIPAPALHEAEQSESPSLRREAQFAENAKHFARPAKPVTPPTPPMAHTDYMKSAVAGLFQSQHGGSRMRY